MRAREILPPGRDRSPEWYAARLAGITASEVAALLGLSPYESAFSLYWRKIGAIPAQPDNTAMSLGRHLESWVADRFAEHRPDLTVAPAGVYASLERPWQLASPDRLLYAGQTLHAGWEGKTSATYDGWGPDGTDEIPVHYRCQTLWQMDTLGVDEIHLSCLFLHSQQVRHYVIRRDEAAVADLELMRERAQAFLARLAAQDAPPIDHTSATLGALKSLWPEIDEAFEPDVEVPDSLADAYEQARRDLAEAEARKDAIENQIREILGDGKRAVRPDGRGVASRSIYIRKDVSAERLKAEFPDAYAACLVDTVIDRLNPARLPKKGTIR